MPLKLDMRNYYLAFWKILNLVSITILANVYIFKGYVMNIIPTCSAKLAGDTCILCGGFRSFIHFIQFDWETSILLNSYVFWFFIILLVNYLVFIFRYFINYVRIY